MSRYGGRGQLAIEEAHRAAPAAAGDFVHFLAAGVRASGEFRCSACGYGVIVHVQLPLCPMCGGDAWERASWRPQFG